MNLLESMQKHKIAPQPKPLPAPAPAKRASMEYKPWVIPDFTVRPGEDPFDALERGYASDPSFGFLTGGPKR